MTFRCPPPPTGWRRRRATAQPPPGYVEAKRPTRPSERDPSVRVRECLRCGSARGGSSGGSGRHGFADPVAAIADRAADLASEALRAALDAGELPGGPGGWNYCFLEGAGSRRVTVDGEPLLMHPSRWWGHECRCGAQWLSARRPNGQWFETVEYWSLEDIAEGRRRQDQPDPPPTDDDAHQPALF